MSESKHASICRFCNALCPIVVTLDDGVPVRVDGNPDSPTYDGFCCKKGRALPEQIAHPDRLLQSLKRNDDGGHTPVEAEAAMDEISDRIAALVAEHGPRSVALYIGTYAGPYPAGAALAGCWLRMLGSHMMFVSSTIDQPGKDVANAMLGRWLAGPQAFDDSDVWMIVGGNPILTMSGCIPPQNPAKRLTDRLAAGMELIVLDPRRTATAKRSTQHLQLLPGQDAPVLAAMIRTILHEGLQDHAFADRWVSNLEALAAAVEPFTPELAAERAGLDADEIVTAARTFAGAERGLATGATGANMSGHSSLVEYLMLCLNTICGRFLREGEPVANPGVLLPRAEPVAQAQGPRPYVDLGEKLSARDLTENASGMPTAAAAEEMLLEGEGRIRALVCLGGNPLAAWPDQQMTKRALDNLDLLVTVDIKMSATAQIADYVIAPKISFEVPTMSHTTEHIEAYSALWGLAEPFGMYAPALVDPPVGSDLIEEWEFFYGLSQRMSVPLFVGSSTSTTATARAPSGYHAVDMEQKPTTDELFELMATDGRIPLSEIKLHPNGARFDEHIPAAPADEGATERLDIGNSDMMRELATLTEVADSARTDEFPLSLLCRRTPNVYNSSGRDLASLTPERGAYNPAFMHPDDLDRIGAAAGDDIDIRSAHGSIVAVAQPDPDLRPGCVSMSHAFGGVPGAEPGDHRVSGSNTSALTSAEDDYDRISGIPRMSALPVAVRLTVESAPAS